MPRKLPPFSALKAFEAAARNGSFARAAVELDVTATAVSQHVKGMESWLGEALFERHSNGVALTPRAERLLPEATRLLDDIARLLPPAAQEDQTVSVTISALRAFADGWLGPHLAEFQTVNPGVTVHVETENRHGHFEREQDSDLIIALAPTEKSGLLSELLFEDTIMPVCTEQYRDLLGLRSLADWTSVTLLHDGLWEGDWQQWSQLQTSAAAKPATLDWTAGPRYPNHWLLLEAVRQGRGIAMAHIALAASSLADQSLVPLAETSVATGQSYHLIRHRGHRSPAAIQLRAWLLQALRTQDHRPAV